MGRMSTGLNVQTDNYKPMRDKGYVVYENGLPIKMIGSLQDVTDLKNLENKLMEEKLARQKEISETVIRVQERERTRIGHELHDNVNQILSTVRMFVDMLTPSGKEEQILKRKALNISCCLSKRYENCRKSWWCRS
jgi:signal transduction histidine kinase